MDAIPEIRKRTKCWDNLFSDIAFKEINSVNINTHIMILPMSSDQERMPGDLFRCNMLVVCRHEQIVYNMDRQKLYNIKNHCLLL